MTSRFPVLPAFRPQSESSDPLLVLPWPLDSTQSSFVPSWRTPSRSPASEYLCRIRSAPYLPFANPALHPYGHSKASLELAPAGSLLLPSEPFRESALPRAH